MAISGGDGSIILTTKVDESGITKSTTSIKAQFAKVGSYLKKIGTSIQTTFSKVGAGIKNTFSKIGNWLKNFATSIAAQFATIFGLYALINFSKQSAEFATQTEASVQRLVDIYGEAAQSVGDFIDANARAIGMSRSAGASIASTYGNLLSVWTDQETNAQLTNSLLNQTAVVASKTGRTTTDVAERIRSGLLGNTEAIEDLGINVNIKTIEITDAFKRIADGRSWEQLNAYEQAQVRTLAILEQSTNKYGTTVAETTATVRNQYQAAYEDFQNTWGQVVNTVLIPVLKILTQVFTIATKGLQVMAGLTGKTVDNSKIQKNSSSGVVDNQKELTKEIEKTNKAQKKSLAAFDEINILSQETAENSSDTGGANVPITGGGGGESYNNSFVDKISGDMAAIMAVIGGALVAVGLLLIFFGRIGWGIGFIITGASVFSVAMATLSSGDQVTPISEQLMKILAIAGTALAALGLILLFSGVWKLGIAFLVAGASALAVSIVAVKKGKATKEAEEMLLDIMLIAGTAMLALGVILLCFGVVSPLSIGLVVAGAASLAGAVAINPTKTFNEIKKFFKDNAGLIVGAASALLVLGIILCAFSVISPLSIGLIVAGAGVLVSEVALNWNAIKESISNFLKDNSGLIVGISLALLVIGIIMCVVGSITPLSIGLIVAGAAGLATEIALNWNAIKTAISDFLKNNSGLIVGVSLALLVLGIILCCTGVALPLGIGLIVVGAAGLASEVVLNWNYIAEKTTQFFQENAGLIVGVSIALIVLGIILLFTGVGIPLAMGLIVAGGGALATTVELNWNFIVDKVKEVWKSVKKFWNENIAPVFTAEWWKNLGKKAMKGLIGGFEAGINGIIGMFEKMINWIVDGLNKITFEVPDWVPGIGGETFGFNISRVKLGRVSIPPLAQGAVIPPNKEFLAILGDQKQGTNIEAPLETIKEAVSEVIETMPVQSEVVNVNFTGDLAQLARVLNPVIEREKIRKGHSVLGFGGA